LWRAGGRAERQQQCRNRAADAVRGEPARRMGTLPGQAAIGDERPGEAQLGVGGKGEPGPA